MVEPVSTAVARMRTLRDTDSQSAVSRSGGMAQVPAKAGATADQVMISAGAANMPQELKSGPPVDLEIVKRIKEAIAEGKYPIDLQAITDSLFESYRDLAS